MQFYKKENCKYFQDLGEQLGEVFKQVSTVIITVIVDIELSDKARNPPELNYGLQGHFLHLIGHLRVFHSDDLHQLLYIHLVEREASLGYRMQKKVVFM